MLATKSTVPINVEADFAANCKDHIDEDNIIIS